MDGIVCGGFAYLLVVDSYPGGVGVADDVAVENHHGNSAAVDFFNHRGECGGFVWRNNNNVEAVVGEIADVGYLLFVAVVGGPDFNGGVFVKHYLALDFVVHLHAPVVLAAL